MTIKLILPDSPEGKLVAEDQSRTQDTVRRRTIKSAVADRILAIAPLHTQQNLSTHRIDLMAKRAAGEPISMEDRALEYQAAEVARRIAAIRAAGKDAIEAGITVDAIAWPE
jgi:hypothetical protein